MTYEGWEPEVVDWANAGDCRARLCERSYAERPSAHCYLKGEHRCNARHGGSIARCDLRKRDCDKLTTDEKATRLGAAPAKVPMTALDVIRGIRKRHDSPPSRMPEYLVLEEFDLGGRRVDALVVRLWSTRGFEVHVYEVKVARSDFVLELKRPEKRQLGMDCSTYFWFATPVGLMRPEEVPEGCGLVEFGVQRGRQGGRYMANVIVEAPKRRIERVPPRLVQGMAWRLRDLERRLQGRGIVL